MPELDQPLMVVVLVIARAAGAAVGAGLFFSGNGRAANMEKHCRGCSAGHCILWLTRHQRRALTTASPICTVPTLVVPSL